MSNEKEHEAYAQREVNDGPTQHVMSNGQAQTPVHRGQEQDVKVYPGLPQQAEPYPRTPMAAYPGQTYNTVTPQIPAPVASPIITTGVWNSILTDRKSVIEAYLLWLILGFVGAHHFYLRRPGFGVIYFFTFGLFGCGYVIDMFRMPYLVSQANKEIGEDAETRNKKNISDAYTLWLPGGLFGLHHYYLRNYGQGVLYTFTFGIFGIGWLIDLIRIPSMVKRTNERTTPLDLEKSVGTAYVFGITPLGLLGLQHFYLNRPIFGLIYLCTFGVFGVGWIVDWFRIPILVKRANKEIMEGTDDEKHLDDAYILWFPLIGLAGMHHFYLRRPVWGFIYLVSFGLFGVGWIVDGFRMACLVKECNKREQERRKLPISFTGNGALVCKANTQTGLVTNGCVAQQSTSQVPLAQVSQVPEYHAVGGVTNPGYYPTQQPVNYPPAYEFQGTNTSQVPTYMGQPPPYSPVHDDTRTPTSATEKSGKS